MSTPRAFWSSSTTMSAKQIIVMDDYDVVARALGISILVNTRAPHSYNRKVCAFGMFAHGTRPLKVFDYMKYESKISKDTRAKHTQAWSPPGNFPSLTVYTTKYHKQPPKNSQMRKSGHRWGSPVPRTSRQCNEKSII